MSCRVLGRKVELAALQDIITHAKKSGANKLVGFYKMTERNSIVKDHYEKLGFTQTSGRAEQEVWELDIKNYKFQKIPMVIEKNI